MKTIIKHKYTATFYSCMDAFNALADMNNTELFEKHFEGLRYRDFRESKKYKAVVKPTGKVDEYVQEVKVTITFELPQ